MILRLKLSIMKHGFISNFLIGFLLFSLFNSCDKTEIEKKGFVTFGANFHVVNCITTVTIFIENENVGTLTNFTNSINDCGEESNITRELSVGDYSYKVEIRPLSGSGCTKDIIGNFTISENQCEKVFIDYIEVFNN